MHFSRRLELLYPETLFLRVGMGLFFDCPEHMAGKPALLDSYSTALKRKLSDACACAKQIVLNPLNRLK